MAGAKTSEVRDMIRHILRSLLKLFIPGLNNQSKLMNPYLMRHFLWNRVLGFNRHIPWPTHFTSQVGKLNRMKIGEDVCPGYSPNCYIQTIGTIEIGDFTQIGPNVCIISGNHDLQDLKRHIPDKVVIGKDCWLGANSVILPGVYLGDGTIVGAGSVVTKSFLHGRVLIAGNPAKIIK